MNDFLIYPGEGDIFFKSLVGSGSMRTQPPEARAPRVFSLLAIGSPRHMTALGKWLHGDPVLRELLSLRNPCPRAIARAWGSVTEGQSTLDTRLSGNHFTGRTQPRAQLTRTHFSQDDRGGRGTFF